MSKNTPTKTTKNEVAAADDYSQFADVAPVLSQSERGIPILTVLQALSPQVAGPEDKMVEGAKPGMLFNTATKELADSLLLIPCTRLQVIQEWRHRDSAQGGGLMGQTFMEEGAPWPQHYKDAMDRCQAEGRKYGDFWTGEPGPDKSHQLKECFQLFALVVDEDLNPQGMVVVPFSSTFIQVYKKDFTQRIAYLPNSANIPFSCYPIRISSESTSKNGKSWKIPKIEFMVENNPLKTRLPADHPAVAAGVELARSAKQGKVAADQQGMEESSAGTSEPEGDSSAF